MTILVDTNVFVDVLKADPVWVEWSLRHLVAAARGEGVVTNFVVYAELHAHDTAGGQVDDLLASLQVDMVDMTRPSARLAAQAFRRYRQRGGSKQGVLPDFFIGAHAQSEGLALLTRDAGRYKTYFPKLQLICP